VGVAFEAALSALRLTDRSDPIVAIVAKQIIALAKAGQSNPDRLCEQALMDVRNSQFSIAPRRAGIDPIHINLERRPRLFRLVDQVAHYVPTILAFICNQARLASNGSNREHVFHNPTAKWTGFGLQVSALRNIRHGY
jgi:hypothetical protein